MKHLAVLAAIYALVAALALPNSLLASEDADPAPAQAPAAQTPAAGSAPAEEAPAAPSDPAAEPAPAPPEQPAAPPEPPVAAPEPAAAPEQLDPAPAQPARKGKDRAAARAAANGSVTIVDFEFQPGSVTIDQGDTVTWTNNGPTAHSATAPDGSFDTGIFPAGQSRSHTFNEAGTFSYICTPHPNMHGTIVVRASQSGGGDTPDSSAGGSGDTGGSSGGGAGTGAESAQTDSGPSLPNTGSDSGAMLVLGALMLLLGIGVRRRAREDQPRAAGRIGW